MRITIVATLAVFVLAALVALAGRGNAGAQSQAALPWMRHQASTSVLAFPAPSGTKKVGSYWWVWTSVKVPGFGAVRTVVALCPKNYVVTGGGYYENGSVNVSDNYPNAPDFTGWIVYANTSEPTSATVTAYAVCAPAT